MAQVSVVRGDPAGFAPVTVTIKCETRDELASVYHRFNAGRPLFRKKAVTGNTEAIYESSNMVGRLTDGTLKERFAGLAADIKQYLA